MTPEERVARIRQKLEEFGVRFDRFSTWSASELVRNEDRIKRYEEMIVETRIVFIGTSSNGARCWKCRAF